MKKLLCFFILCILVYPESKNEAIQGLVEIYAKENKSAKAEEYYNLLYL